MNEEKTVAGHGAPRRRGHLGDAAGPRRHRGARFVPVAVAVGLVLAVTSALSGCSTNPHSPDISAPPTTADAAVNAGSDGPLPSRPPGQGPGHRQAKQPKVAKQGIVLPNTITLAYDRTPTFQDLTHHIVLWNANQAVRAELAASYQRSSAATPDLRRYWTGPGYTEAYNWSQAWIDTKSRPVGRIVVSAVSVDSLTGQSATVSYCQDMSGVVRGDALTYSAGKALQAPHTDGEHVVLTLVPTGTKGLWQVVNQVVETDSASCSPSAEHRSKLA